MKRGILLAVPCAIALLIGGVLLWPTAPTTDTARQQATPANSNHHHDPVKEAADALQARYRTFVSAQSSLTVPTEITLASLQILFDEREQLRQQSFTPAEQAQLFAEDRLMEQLTLRRRVLAEARDSDKSQLASELDLW
ncbi:MAG: lipase secretion chaperone, partial [Aeromonas sobria]